MPVHLMIVSLLLSCMFVFNVNAGELKQTTFKNGVKLIVEEDHSAPVAMVQIWLKVGGRDEVPGKTGLAHVFEHMMFKGSKQLEAGEYSKRISAMGGNDNALPAPIIRPILKQFPQLVSEKSCVWKPNVLRI